MAQRPRAKLKRVVKLTENKPKNIRVKAAPARKIRIGWRPSSRQPLDSFICDAMSNVRQETHFRVILLIRIRIQKNSTWTAPIGIEEICEQIGRKRTIVHKALKELEKIGYISKEKKGFGAKNRYKLGNQ